MTDRLVIIGAGQAGFALAAKLRALKDERPITLTSPMPATGSPVRPDNPFGGISSESLFTTSGSVAVTLTTAGSCARQ